jgi:hypothetical protein
MQETLIKIGGARTMDAFTGTLSKDGQVVAENITGRLSVDWSPSQQQAWTGFCLLPMTARVNLGDVLDLVLDDGRSSSIKIERVNETSAGQSVSFGQP